jgi:hypothetical protein
VDSAGGVECQDIPYTLVALKPRSSFTRPPSLHYLEHEMHRIGSGRAPKRQGMIDLPTIVLVPEWLFGVVDGDDFD